MGSLSVAREVVKVDVLYGELVSGDSWFLRQPCEKVHYRLTTYLPFGKAGDCIVTVCISGNREI
jgi:hypothetical protein